MTAVEKQHLIDALSYQIGRVERKFVREQAVNLLVNVDREMACIVAYNVGVDYPSGTNVPVSTSYPSLSIFNTRYYAYTQKVGVLIGDGFNSQEVINVLNLLKQHGVFVDIVSETLGTVTGADGTKLEVDKTFLTSSPYLLDSLFILGGSANNEAKYYQDIMYYTKVAYKDYKPIGVTTSAQSYIPTSKENNLAGVVFGANNPNFGNEFVEAVAIQRFWSRT
ncbi:DJ-1/PfpI family protein [Lentibacillus jeotgali]|uniref:DJ-1/PfpI family protein n=1 Tax=Lentibacillus jeotgali TaxID=558169 RepID=UPI000262933B|nr:DJ-1/PfpI family protein [Lentibacillus jeotgali]